MTETTKKVYKILKKLNTIWHPDSTLVFKSQKDKRAIGRYVDGEFVSFDQTTLELCTEWDFKYDESLVDDNSEGGTEENGGGEEEGREEEGAEEEGGEEEGGEEEGGEEEEQRHEHAEEEHAEEPVVKLPTSNVIQNFTEHISSIIENAQAMHEVLLIHKTQLAEKDLAHESLSLEHAKLRGDYDRLNKKFEGIKQLFA
jgi:hypothetical protein